MAQQDFKLVELHVKLCVMPVTFGMEGNEAVTQRPLLHRFIEYNLLWKNDHGDVLKLTEPLHNLSHWFGF